MNRFYLNYSVPREHYQQSQRGILFFPSILQSIYFLFCLLLMSHSACKTAQKTSTDRSVPPIPTFERIVIDSTFERAYQVSAADMNGDGRTDIIALSTRLPDIVWYENPGWEKHIISMETTGNIDLAPQDIDGDGDMDLALASDFNLRETEKPGHLYWLQNLHNGEDWKLHKIDASPVPHRVRWADVDGDGQEELINLPIMGYGAKEPDYRPGLEFAYYELPEDPEETPWEKHMIDTSLHVSHGLHVVQWDEDAPMEILTASFEGIRLYQPVPVSDGLSWQMTPLARGDLSPYPRSGCSEVSPGFLQQNKQTFIATIEPWHGEKLMIYTHSSNGQGWQGKLIDSTFNDGHALLTCDLNGDGSDEIIAGYRGPDYNLYIYQFEAGIWERYALDEGGISASGIFLFDFDGDDQTDVVVGGSATNNVVLYRNSGVKK